MSSSVAQDVDMSRTKLPNCTVLAKIRQRRLTRNCHKMSHLGTALRSGLGGLLHLIRLAFETVLSNGNLVSMRFVIL
jgi:hypothetical protein